MIEGRPYSDKGWGKRQSREWAKWGRVFRCARRLPVASQPHMCHFLISVQLARVRKIPQAPVLTGFLFGCANGMNQQLLSRPRSAGQPAGLFGNSRWSPSCWRRAQHRTGMGCSPACEQLLVSVRHAFFLLAFPGPSLYSYAWWVLAIPLQPIPSVEFSLFELPKLISVLLAGLWLIQRTHWVET